MGPSNQAMLTETGNDTGIFRTKIPEVNQDDDPDIITRVGESSGLADHKSKPAEFSLTHRFTADSAEIDYVKKNGEYLNDFDSNEEIKEEERLHFPVWRGPDYEENDIKNYLISNMIFNQEDCQSLDQTQFIPKNAKFRIKIIDNDEDENFVFINLKSIIKNNRVIGPVHEIINIKCTKKSDGEFYSEFVYTVFNEFQDEFVNVDGKFFKVLKISEKKYENNKIVVEYKLKSIEAVKPEKAAYLLLYETLPERKIFNNVFYIYELFLIKKNFNEIVKKVKEMGYFCNVDVSPTKKEILGNLPFYSIFYFGGHGLGNSLVEDSTAFYGFEIFKENTSEKEEKGDLFYSQLITEELTEKLNYKLVFLNTCHSGNKGFGLHGGYQDYIKAFKAQSYIGFKGKIPSFLSRLVSKKVFQKASETKKFPKATENVLKDPEVEKYFDSEYFGQDTWEKCFNWTVIHNNDDLEIDLTK